MRKPTGTPVAKGTENIIEEMGRAIAEAPARQAQLIAEILGMREQMIAEILGKMARMTGEVLAQDVQECQRGVLAQMRRIAGGLPSFPSSSDARGCFPFF